MRSDLRLGAAPLAPSARRTLLALIAAGTVVRLVWTLDTAGLPFDISSAGATAHALLHDPLHLYGALNSPHQYRWPYPPGYFPWLLASHGLVSLGIPFRVGLVLPAIAADGALAWVVQAALGRRGASDRSRLVACALVAFGPAFALISGLHGQIDSVAILPAALALLVWEGGNRRRALYAGVLVGLAASCKTAPGLVLLALLPSARTRREAAALCAVAVAIPLVALAPFLAADATGVLRALRYAGIPGEGGISMLIQPDLARYWVFDDLGTQVGPVTRAFIDHGIVLTGVALALTAAVTWRRRLAARDAAVVLWLGLYVLGTAFAFQYAVWGLPFLIIAGRLRWALWMQAGLLVPELVFYFGPWHSPELLLPLYVALMGVVWLGQATALAVSVRARSRPVPAPAGAPA